MLDQSPFIQDWDLIASLPSFLPLPPSFQERTFQADVIEYQSHPRQTCLLCHKLQLNLSPSSNFYLTNHCLSLINHYPLLIMRYSVVFIFWPIRLHFPVPYCVLAVLLRWRNKWSQERYELSLWDVCCLIPRPPKFLEMGLGMRLIVSNNDDVILSLFLCSSEMESQLSGEYTGFQLKCCCSWHWPNMVVSVQCNSIVVWNLIISARAQTLV